MDALAPIILLLLSGDAQAYNDQAPIRWAEEVCAPYEGLAKLIISWQDIYNAHCEDGTIIIEKGRNIILR